MLAAWEREREACEAANRVANPLRRPLFFPTRLRDVDDINEPSTDRYGGFDDGYITPKIHWTFLSEIVDYQHANFVGRPDLLCKDSDGVQSPPAASCWKLF
jgi:hypothetical protein